MGVQHFPERMELPPIPKDVKPGRGWCRFMMEMADHIGAYDVLRICEALGGQQFIVPADHLRSPILPVIGAAGAQTVSHVYRHELICIPLAKVAIFRARRAPVLASIRCGALTVSEAARRLGVRRDNLSRLVNQTDEGDDAVPLLRPGRKVDPRQIDMFADSGG